MEQTCLKVENGDHKGNAKKITGSLKSQIKVGEVCNFLLEN